MKITSKTLEEQDALHDQIADLYHKLYDTIKGSSTTVALNALIRLACSLAITGNANVDDFVVSARSVFESIDKICGADFRKNGKLDDSSRDPGTN